MGSPWTAGWPSSPAVAPGLVGASALVLAEYGADVVLAGRRPEPLIKTAAEAESMGRRALAVPCDVTTAAQCQQIVDTTIERAFGRVDILINCAGGAETKSIRKWTDDEFDHVMDLNFGAVWHLSRAVSGPMLNQGKGAIVNIFLRCQPAGHAAGSTLWCGEGGGEQPDRIDGLGLDAQGSSGKCDSGRCCSRRDVDR